ncbi:MAG: DUF61 family protein [Euryarchaeota archaeon]|nr:DUF61 family protein [Euryarchaeota archaeon]
MIENFNRADRILKKQILSLNRHVPTKRKTLTELLKEEKPHVIGSDGTRHRFRRDELIKLSEMIPESEYSGLKLPIYIEVKSTTSPARVSGKLECEIVSKILDTELEFHDNQIFLYKPYLKILRNFLPTTTQYLFLVR